MTTNLYQWAARHGVSVEAVADLRALFGMNGDCAPLARSHGTGESGVQMALRMEAANKGLRLWRNNVGALEDKTGRFVRYGLANDSKQVNERIKSADLIGCRPVTIAPHHVGTVIGQFVSREVKEPGWRYTGTDREQAQLRWIELVVSLGGDAAFATGQGTL